MHILPAWLELFAKWTVRVDKGDEPAILLFNWYLFNLLTNSGLVESEIVKQDWLIYGPFRLFSCFLSEFFVFFFSFIVSILFPLLLHLNDCEAVFHFDSVFKGEWELPRDLGAWEFWETSKSWDFLCEIAQRLYSVSLLELTHQPKG